VVQKTHRRWRVCAHQNYHKACTFTQTFDAIPYLNKRSCAPILNFSPKRPTGGSAKGKISNRIVLAIFAAILRGLLAHPVATSTKVDSLWMAYALWFMGIFLPVLHCPLISDAFVF